MVDQFRASLIITRREIRDQFRDWRIIIPIILLTVIFPGIMNFTAKQAVDFVARYGASIIGDRLIPFLLMVVGFFPMSISLVIALESFVGEKERRSIEPLLSSPMKDWQLYIGKLLAVIVPPLMASFLGILIYLIGVYNQIGWYPEPVLITQILLLTTVQAVVMVSGAVVISTQATSVRAANLLASFIIIPMAFLIQGESMVMFWAQYDVLWVVILGLIVLSAILVRTGVSHFNREEMLGRELDNFNIKGTWRFFWQQFTGDARNLKTWYRTEVLQSLKEYRLPVLIMFAFMILSFWLGSRLAIQFPLPPSFINTTEIQFNNLNAFGSIPLLSPAGVPIVWFHNMRAMLIALALGIFTFGVLGIMVVMLPFILIGYLAAVFSGAGITPALFFFAFILPHGVFEIPALLLVGAGILYIGAKLVAPSDGKSIGEVFVIGLAEWLRIAIAIVVPLLLIAAAVEVFVTPNVVIRLLG